MSKSLVYYYDRCSTLINIIKGMTLIKLYNLFSMITNYCNIYNVVIPANCIIGHLMNTFTHYMNFIYK